MDKGDKELVTKNGNSIVVLPELPRGGVEPITAAQVWTVFRRRWHLATVVALLVFTAGMVFTYRQPPVYESTASIIVPESHTTPVTSEDLGMVSDLITLAREKSTEGQAQIMASPQLIYETSGRLDAALLKRGYHDEPSVTQWGILPDWAVSAVGSKSSNLVTVTAKAYDPEVAAEVANTVVRTYMEHDRGLLGQTIQLGRQYTASEMHSVRKQLDTARQELAAFQRKSGLVVPDSQAASLAEKAVVMQANLDAANVELAGASRQVESIDRQLAEQGTRIEESQSVQRNPEYQNLLTRLSDLNSQKVAVMQEYAAESKQVRQVQASIADTQSQLQKVARTVIAATTQSRNPLLASYSDARASSDALQAKAQALAQLVGVRRSELDSLPDEQRTYAQLSQNVKTLEASYEALSAKYYALLFNERSTLPNSLFAATARPPLEHSYPNKRKNALAFLLLAIVAGAGAALIAERADSRLRDPVAVSKLTSKRLLSLVPTLEGTQDPNLAAGNVRRDSLFAESFRVLRNNIYWASMGEPVKMMAVTSPGRREGKGTVAINLAATIAMCGTSVLVVDCDFRQPSANRRVGRRHVAGLWDLAQGLAGAKDAVVPTELANVSFLPCGPGPENPAEFLISHECRRVLRALGAIYDVVILDCPPCAELSDVQCISRLVDSVVMVAALGYTTRNSLEKGLDMLAQVEAPLMGLVLNRAGNSSDVQCDRYTVMRRGLRRVDRRSQEAEERPSLV